MTDQTNLRDKVVERAARALCRHSSPFTPEDEEFEGRPVWTVFEDEARAALKAAHFDELVEAVRREVRHCPLCKGDGVTVHSAEYLFFPSPTSKRKPSTCPRCKESRSVLKLLEGE